MADHSVSFTPLLSVIMPTFNNGSVLQRAIDLWHRFGGEDVELIVIEDGCTDETSAFLEHAAATPWGQTHLRSVHEEDAHELRCTNRGFGVARGMLLAAWQDDMLLQASWLVPELLANFSAYPDLGILSLSRGLICTPCSDPIERWEDLTDWRRLQSTIGQRPHNWWRLQEVDAVVRPWVIRRACLDRVGLLDEAFRPTEWDEADLAFRVREAGWKVGTFGYERLGGYLHLGSTTIGTPSADYRESVLKNGRLFHMRWDPTIAQTHNRQRQTWRRQATSAGWAATLRESMRLGARRLRGAA